MRYLRLLRLQDQYLSFASSLGAGLFLGIRESWLLVWALATTLLSCTAFLVNELVDRQDVDVHSWNPVHVSRIVQLNMPVVWTLFAVLSVSGLYISYRLGLFWWGMSLYILGLAYSLPPLRLKGRSLADALVQLLVWWVLPFLAPVMKYTGGFSGSLIFIISVAFLAWASFFPYQLADFTADRQAGLHNSHIVLGLGGSLIGGFILGLLGLILYASSISNTGTWWAFVFAAVTFYALYFYWRLFRHFPAAKWEEACVGYVRRVKPVSQLLFVYVLGQWFLFR